MAVDAQEPQVLDQARLNAFVGRAIDDWGALGGAALTRIGDRLGLYEALADGQLVRARPIWRPRRAPSNATSASGC